MVPSGKENVDVQLSAFSPKRGRLHLIAYCNMSMFIWGEQVEQEMEGTQASLIKKASILYVSSGKREGMTRRKSSRSVRKNPVAES